MHSPSSSIRPHLAFAASWRLKLIVSAVSIRGNTVDRLEETLTGKGTSHRVNGIAVQAKVYEPYLPNTELPHVEKKKQRSVSAVHQELEVYVAGARVGPQPLPTRETDVQEAEKAAQVACRKNLVWIVSRQAYQDNQAIPSWTGFNIRARDQVAISEDVVGYLLTINHQPQS